MGRVVWLMVVSALALLPLAWCIASDADFIAFANESLAYRFFYSARLQAGPDMTAWLPQGQLITSVQHLITWQLPALSAETLRSSLNSFSLWSLAAIAGISIGGLAVGAASRVASWQDRFLLAVVALVPFYALPNTMMGVWPDYYGLNVSLAIICLALFQWEWRSPSERSLARITLYGLLAGSVAANKISMVVLAGPLIVTAMVSGATPAAFIARAAVTAAATIAAFGFWFLASGLFRVDWIVGVLPRWWRLISNPGGQPHFEAVSYVASNYWVVTLWFGIALACVMMNRRDGRRLAVVVMAVVSALLCAVAIWKRPAVTTASDTAIILLALGAMLFTACERSRGLGATVAAAIVLLAATSLVRTQVRQELDIVTASKRAGDAQWAFFEQVQREAGGRPIHYFIPDNYYQHGDVFILLLKGSTDFPTWNVGENGKALLRRLDLDITFVSNAAYPNGWQETIDGGSALVWINADHLRKIEDHYPALSAATKLPGTRHDIVNLPLAGASGHIVRLP